MRVGIYARYSSDRQSDTSLRDQIRLCQARAKREDWTVVGVYEDAAASGSLRMRKGYQTLLTDALSGKFDLVLAESLDRLNRDLEETARLFKRLKFVNVGIVTVSEGSISEVHVSITGLMGEMYLKSLGEKTRRGLEGRVLAGKSGGGRCYGYDVVSMNASGQPVTGERKTNEAEAEVVREIFRRFAGGEGPRAIARALNERGVPGPHGRLGATRLLEDTPRRAPASSTTQPMSADLVGDGSASSRIQRVVGASLASIHPVAKSWPTYPICALSMRNCGRQ